MGIRMPLLFPIYAIGFFTNLWYNRSMSERQIDIYLLTVLTFPVFKALRHVKPQNMYSFPLFLPLQMIGKGNCYYIFKIGCIIAIICI